MAMLLALLAGCSGPVETAPEGPTAGENLNKIQSAYRQATDKLRRPPRNQEELKPYLAGEDLDSLFRSPSDGQPFVMHWGTDVRNVEAGGGGADFKPLVIGYEKEGKDGSRQVLTVMGVMEMTDDEFASANFPEGKKP